METRFTVYGTNDTRLISKIEKDFIGFADSYKINHWTIPALIDGNTLRKYGYFKTMPNQLTAAGHFTDEVCKAVESDCVPTSKSCTFNGYFFTPAACIHLYPHIKKADIYNEVITTYARVYRYENGKYERGKRLWDFGVREFVAVGTKEYVKKFLDDFKEKALNYAESMGISVTQKRANDHFYPSKENVIKEKMQKANSLKTELVATVDGKELALASFNYHEFHFSKSFDFDKNGKIVTGCVGFGLDRWIYVLNELQLNE